MRAKLCMVLRASTKQSPHGSLWRALFGGKTRGLRAADLRSPPCCPAMKTTAETHLLESEHPRGCTPIASSRCNPCPARFFRPTDRVLRERRTLLLPVTLAAVAQKTSVPQELETPLAGDTVFPPIPSVTGVPSRCAVPVQTLRALLGSSQSI